MLIYQIECERITLCKINKLKEYNSRRIFIVIIRLHSVSTFIVFDSEAYAEFSWTFRKDFLWGIKKRFLFLQSSEKCSIIILRKIREKIFLEAAMNELSSHHFQFAADFSSDIVFKSDIFDCDVTTSNTWIENEIRSQSSLMIKE